MLVYACRNTLLAFPFAVHREEIREHARIGSSGRRRGESNVFSIPGRPFNSPNARGEARTGDVFITLIDPPARRTDVRVYAPMRCLLQSAEWIRQTFQPLKFGGKAVENECSAYILWGMGTLERGNKTDMYDEMLQ
jgi:hypothetical protein